MPEKYLFKKILGEGLFRKNTRWRFSDTYYNDLIKPFLTPIWLIKCRNHENRISQQKVSNTVRFIAAFWQRPLTKASLSLTKRVFGADDGSLFTRETESLPRPPSPLTHINTRYNYGSHTWILKLRYNSVQFTRIIYFFIAWRKHTHCKCAAGGVWCRFINLMQAFWCKQCAAARRGLQSTDPVQSHYYRFLMQTLKVSITLACRLLLMHDFFSLYVRIDCQVMRVN